MSGTEIVAVIADARPSRQIVLLKDGDGNEIVRAEQIVRLLRAEGRRGAAGGEKQRSRAQEARSKLTCGGFSHNGSRLAGMRPWGEADQKKTLNWK